jgi:fructokinase
MDEGLKYADILKVSDEEMALMTGETDLEAGSLKLAKYGSSLVTVTLGEKGAFYRMGDMCGLVPGYSVKVADTNGAGDTFHGAFVAARVKGMEVPEAAAFASATSALKCTRVGAQEGIPNFDEVLGFMKESKAVIRNG